MRITRTIALAAVAGALCTPATAGATGPTGVAASRCSIGDTGISYNLAGDGAQFSALKARRGMNCSSARYVLNNWLRRKFENSYAHRLPTKFYDGYVTWYCGKYTRTRWQCDEYDSG